MARFAYFVVFAEMRTGSNLLEANINLFDDLNCYGEAFNPSFIGYPQNDNLLGVTLEAREQKPDALIEKIKQDQGLSGFRFFNNHDPRALAICMADPKCAKVILTRNPVESYVSWKIAKVTGQWKLTNPTHAKTEKVTFDMSEFEAHLHQMQGFQSALLSGLQTTGQTGFYLAYEDLSDVGVMNGLARFLGVDQQLNALNRKLKKQNPAALSEKVTNPAEMAADLAQFDRFNLSRTPNFEPRRGPMIPRYVAAPDSGLLYLPLQSGLDQQVAAWMAALNEKPIDALLTAFSQKSLRQWKQAHKNHRSFTVLRHPVLRAHHAFCQHILFEGPQVFPHIRQTLRKVHKLPIPKEPIPRRNLRGYDIKAHHRAFLAFLVFLKHNLSAQTAVRTDPSWASQLNVLQGMSQFGLPDMILREAQLERDLAILAEHVGATHRPKSPTTADIDTDLLSEIYDNQIETAAQDAYGRDYLAFGFEDWR